MAALIAGVFHDIIFVNFLDEVVFMYERPAFPPSECMRRAFAKNMKKFPSDGGRDTLYEAFLATHGDLNPACFVKAVTPEEAAELDRIADEWERKFASLPPCPGAIR